MNVCAGLHRREWNPGEWPHAGAGHLLQGRGTAGGRFEGLLQRGAPHTCQRPVRPASLLFSNLPVGVVATTVDSALYGANSCVPLQPKR